MAIDVRRERDHRKLRAMRALVAVWVVGLLVSCGGKSSEPVVKSSSTNPRGGGAGVPDGPVPFSKAILRSCMLHAGVAGHFECLAGADGTCFHFGTTCDPVDPCVLDTGSGLHKTCKRFADGVCEEFSEACTPVSKCMFIAGEDRYHSCPGARGGVCSEPKELCLPDPQAT